MKKDFWRAKFWPIVGWSAWIVFAFFAAQFVAALILTPLQMAKIIDISHLSTFASALVEASIYALMLTIAVGVPLLRSRKLHPKTGQKSNSRNLARQMVGTSRPPSLADLGFTLSNAPIFYLTLLAAGFVLQFILGGGIMTQEQSLSFATAGNDFWQLAIIFAALVIIAPLAEEMLMRGFLFAKLRAKLTGRAGFWITSIIVSLLFAVAHWQINVGIMTFILSMFTCRMREKTGAIWAGVGLHMIVNLIAFSLRFIIT